MEESFAGVKQRLDEIVDQAGRDDIPMDDLLALYDEAVNLGLKACELAEKNISTFEMDAAQGDLDETHVPHTAEVSEE